MDRTTAAPIYGQTRVGSYAAQQRNAASLSQMQLAETAGIDVQTVARCEQGYDVRVSSFAAIAAALGVSLDDLWRGGPAS